MAQPKTRMRLRAILQNVDFRKNELTNYEEFRKSTRFPGELQKGEAYLMVSRSQDQLLWVLDVTTEDNRVRIIDTRKWRITSGSWNPMMLQEYAGEIGIELIGMRTFGEAYQQERARKRQLRVEHKRDQEGTVYYGLSD